MARSTLSSLITELRGLTDAQQLEWRNGTAQFWDDDQLAAALDRHVTRLDFRPLAAAPTYAAGGTPVYQEYRSGFANFEATDGGTARFVVEDSTGADIGTALWTADYAAGLVTFLADTQGTAYWLTGRSYNLNAAAADVWRRKAAQAAKSFNFSTDNHSVQRSQVYEHCLEQARYYEQLAGPVVSTLYRSDLEPGW